MEQKSASSNIRKLTDVIAQYWDNPNYQLLIRQANSIMKEYKLDYVQLRQIIRYAIEYNDELPNEELSIGLYQYFPKYIKPCMEFQQAILKSREAEDIEEESITFKRSKYIGTEETF